MSRREILKAFKALHRITQETFQGDISALQEAREQINQEFKKNKKINEDDHVAEQLKVAKDVGDILKLHVVQAVKNPGSEAFGKTESLCLELKLYFRFKIYRIEIAEGHEKAGQLPVPRRRRTAGAEKQEM